MPEFMVMILADEAEEGRLPPSETKTLIEGHSAYERKLRSVSAYVDGGRLRPSAEGRRVSVREGQARVEAGPFVDAPLGGYYLVRAETLDAAVALAEQCPVAPGTALDVRPIMKGFVAPEKENQRGRVFAFTVLGNAQDERGWIDVMDRIDDAAGDLFPTDRFLGGVRLHAPGRGRRLSSVGGQRAVFDGPFLESKEVIGGVMFMRMSTLEEAVAAAKLTQHALHGVVEIRELWRS